MELLDEHRLLDQIRKGNKEAFAELVEPFVATYGTKLFAAPLILRNGIWLDIQRTCMIFQRGFT